MLKGVNGLAHPIPPLRHRPQLLAPSSPCSLPGSFEGLAFPLSLPYFFALVGGDLVGRDYVPWHTCFYVQRKACKWAAIRLY